MRSHSRKLTLEDIAAQAGVSRATVSRVVNNYPHITSEVRERVQTVIQNSGYRPHKIAQSLASRRSGMIGLVIPQIASTILTNPYFLYLIDSITRATNHHDLTLALFLFHSTDEEDRVAKSIFNTSLLDGVVITADRREDSFVRQLLEHGVPVVFIGKPGPNIDVPYVNVDNEKGGYMATTHLIQRNRRRIAAITALDNTAGDDRYAGYRRALEAHGLPFRESLTADGDFSQESGYLAMKNLLKEAPDAVFVSSDVMALGAQRAVREAGLCIPDDVSMVGFDDLPQAATAEPPLTTIRQPIDQLGPLAIALLKQAIELNHDAVESCVLPVDLIVRES